MIKNTIKQITPRVIIKIYRRIFWPFHLGGSGERVNIDYQNLPPFREMDMYQKSHIRRYEFALRQIKSDDVCGDFACGTGYGTVMLAEKSEQAIGVDINSRVIKEIKARYSEIKNVSFVKKNILKFEYKDVFNILVSFETIEHLKENKIPKLFKRFNKALKPNGTFIFSTPYIELASKEALNTGFHKTFNIDENKINKWLQNAGFTKAHFFYQNYETHDVSSTITPKDFVIGVVYKKT